MMYLALAYAIKQTDLKKEMSEKITKKWEK